MKLSDEHFDEKPSMKPAIFISNKASDFVEAFENGITIRAPDAHYLALPEGPAKARLRSILILELAPEER